MAVSPVPAGYHTVTPYLVVKGAKSLIQFCQKAFDAKSAVCHETPEGAVMHGEVRIGDSVVMMAEASGQHAATPAMLHLYVPDVDAWYRRAIAAGATSIREPADQFYGDRSGGVKDAFGNQWWLSTHKEDVSPEEMERRMKAQKGAECGAPAKESAKPPAKQAAKPSAR